jgi:hypothetical protein
MRRNNSQKGSRKEWRAGKRMIKSNKGERDREEQQERKKVSERKKEIKREEGRGLGKRGERISPAKAIPGKIWAGRGNGGRKLLLSKQAHHSSLG